MADNITGKESRGMSPAALLVAGAFFMEFLDGTVIATALPDMAKSFGVQAVDLNIGISAYLITLAVLIPASGWIADRFGARKVFAVALAIFTLASVFCGLSTTVDQFVAMRILQGMGGALMVSLPGFAWARKRANAAGTVDAADSGARKVDARLLAGSAVFGVGWGIAGYCPGPALANLSQTSEAIIFAVAMLTGSQLARWLAKP